MFDLDLDGIEEVAGGLKAGEHLLTVAKAELKETKSGTGMYYKVEFTADNGQKHWENYNVKNDSEIAQKIGRQQFKAFLTKAGYKEKTFNDVNKMIGLSVLAKIKVTEDDKWGEQRSITSYKAAPNDPLKGDDPFV